MANNQAIDSLSIDIKITGLKQNDITKLGALSTNLESLKKVLTPSFLNNLKSLGKVFNSFSNIGNLNTFFKSFTTTKALSISETSKALSKLDKVVSNSFINRLQKLAQINLGFRSLKGLHNFLSEYNKKQEQIQKLKLQQPQLEQQEVNLEKYPTQRMLEQKGKQKTPFFEQIKNLQKQAKSNLKNLKGIGFLFGGIGLKGKGEDEYNDEEISKIGNKKSKQLLKSIKRIALYRAIRTILSSITQSLKEGIMNLASYDQNFNKTMSSIATSTQNIKNAVGLMIQPFMEQFAPILEQISQIFINIANEISRINALQKGNATYTKINADYAKDYANSMSKASGFAFDTFNVLSGGTGNMYETASVDDVENEGNTVENSFAQTITNIQNIVIDAIEILTTAVKSFLTVLSPFLWFASTIAEGITFLLTKLPVLSAILGGLLASILLINIALNTNPILLIITAVIAGIGLIIKYAEQIGEVFQKVWNSGKNGFFIVINALGKLFGQNWNIKVNEVSLPKLSYYAEGGIAKAGSLFVAGESGAELLTNMGGGNTGITNVEQFETAMTRAIVSSGLLDAVQNSDIYLDNEKVGGKVGQSISLRRQLNRTNPNLKLK